jgi:hypothetical protein
MAVSLRPMSFQDPSRDWEGLNAGLGAASFLAASWVCAGAAKIPTARISATAKYTFFMTSPLLVWIESGLF